MKRSRYQFGTLYIEHRKTGADVWVYRWRDTNLEGQRQYRKQILGTVQEIPSQADALQVAETYRLSANRHTGDHAGTPLTLGKLIEHYKAKEMPMDNHEEKRRSTKLAYLSNLDNHILPRWGEHHPNRVTAIEIEEWIKSLKLAPASRAKVRNVLSMIFRHGIRWGWLDRNPVAMVRVSSKRLRRPDILTAEEFRSLLAKLPDRERLLGVLCATTGMRIGEALGLKWQDIHFDKCEADVFRSFSDGAIGPCKTEISEQPVPLDDIVLEELRGWHPVCGYPKPDDWIFASDYNFGKTPLWPDSLRTKVLQPTARRVGITKKIGWHTFRRTYSSLLTATGDDVKVVQELMRHAKISTTMEVYAQAGMEKKRVAQRRAVDVLLDRKPKSVSSEWQRETERSQNGPAKPFAVPEFAV